MARYSSVVTRKGQVTIPIEVRRALCMREGDTVIFEVEAGGLGARFETAEAYVNATAGILKFVGPIDEKAAMREYGEEAARKYALLGRE